jgi:hypothetical protein
VNKDEMGTESSTHGSGDNAYGILIVEGEGKRPFVDLDVNGEIILKFVLIKSVMT